MFLVYFRLRIADYVISKNLTTQVLPTRHSISRVIRGIKAESILECFEQWVNTYRVWGGQIADYL
jgi:hypothetical protein